MTVDAFQVSSALLLLTLVVGPPDHLPTVARLLFTVGLVVPFVARRFASFWLLGFVLFLASPLERAWLTLDNHEVLQIYWFGAFALSRFAQHPGVVLRAVARWVLVLVFVFATAWKLLAPDFGDGSALAFLAGVEPRIADVAVALNIQDEDSDETNRGRLRNWWDDQSGPESFEPDIGMTIRRVAPLLAVATVVLEALVAATLLWPLARRHHWTRDAALLAFVLLTYPLTPVLVFAWLLLSLGAMQSSLDATVRNRFYLGAFVVVTFVYGLRELTLFPVLRLLTGH